MMHKPYLITLLNHPIGNLLDHDTPPIFIATQCSRINYIDGSTKLTKVRLNIFHGITFPHQSLNSDHPGAKFFQSPNECLHGRVNKPHKIRRIGHPRNERPVLRCDK